MTNKIPTTNIADRKDSAQVKFKHYHYLPNANAYLNVVQSGCRFKANPGYQTRVNIYDHYIIHYITSGSGTYIVDNQHYPLKKGDLFLIRPYQFNYYVADDVNPYTYYWVGFTGLEALNLLNLTEFNKQPVINDAGNDLTPLFKSLFELEGNSIALKHGLTGYLQLILSKLMAAATHDSVQQNPYYLQAIDFILKHYDNPDLNVQMVAKHVGVTRSHLYRVFYKASNYSINHSILNIRLSKAVILLANQALSIKEIAFKTGFNSSVYFTKQFKAQFHCSPSEYRQNLE